MSELRTRGDYANRNGASFESVTGKKSCVLSDHGSEMQLTEMLHVCSILFHATVKRRTAQPDSQGQ